MRGSSKTIGFGVGSGLLGLLMCITAGSDEVQNQARPSVHVDLARVIETRHVEAVDGVTSSGQPDAKALRIFADSGYVAVIDMRGEDEDRGLEDEREVVEGLGLKYVALPITSPAAISFDNARKLDELLQSYTGPVLLHCGSGNRVGALLAMRASLAGKSDEEAIAHGRDAGLTSLEPLIRERLGAAAPEGPAP